MGAMDTTGTTGKSGKRGKGATPETSTPKPMSALDKRIAAFTFVYELGDVNPATGRGTLIRLTARDAERIMDASRKGVNEIREDQRAIDKAQRDMAQARRDREKAIRDRHAKALADELAELDTDNPAAVAAATPAVAAAAAVKAGNAIAAQGTAKPKGTRKTTAKVAA